MNWDNFTCCGCSGQINETLYWRAHQASRRDTVAIQICEIPEISYTTADDTNDNSNGTHVLTAVDDEGEVYPVEQLRVIGNKR